MKTFRIPYIRGGRIDIRYLGAGKLTPILGNIKIKGGC